MRILSIAFAALLPLAGCYVGHPNLSGAATDADTSETEGSGGDTLGDDDGLCPSGIDAGQGLLRRLTRAQYENTVRDLLGLTTDVTRSFLADDRVGAFATNSTVPITELGIEKYQLAAEDLAEQAASDLDRLLPCTPSGDGRECAQEFIETWGMQAYRRPLGDDEVAGLLAVYDVGAGVGAAAVGAPNNGFERGVRLVIQACLQSPNFIYMLEFDGETDGEAGSFVVPLSDYEIATRLSYTLWNSTPDSTLLAVAATGQLQDPAQLEAQARRLLDDERSLDTVREFHTQWLGLSDLSGVTKFESYFAGFDDVVRSALVEEAERFVEHVFTNEGASLSALLTADYGFPSEPLYEIYGITAADVDAQGKATFPAGQRSGVLTLAGPLATLAHPDRTSPILRGILVREHLLCLPIPPPPPGVQDTLPEPDPNRTEQEILREHQENPDCSTCHKVIDPIGFLFENYDGVGRFRAQGEGVDASGALVGSDVDAPLVGVPALAEQLLQSEVVEGCIADQWFAFGLGRAAGSSDVCSHDTAVAALRDSGGDIREMLVALVTSTSFRYRNTQ